MKASAQGSLQTPSVTYTESMRDYLIACAFVGESVPWDPSVDASDEELRHYIEKLSRGIWSESDEADSTSTFHYWYIIDSHIRGRCTLRTKLLGSFGETHGNIGYDVHPDFREMGIGTAMLQQLLNVAREKHLANVLITCDPTNIASARIIEKCGGVMRDTFEGRYLRFDVSL
jgi:predicted acetyltransferase